jgi:hypothetical protein
MPFKIEVPLQKKGWQHSRINGASSLNRYNACFILGGTAFKIAINKLNNIFVKFTLLLGFPCVLSVILCDPDQKLLKLDLYN